MLQLKELRLGNLVIWNPKLTNPSSTLPGMYIEVYEIMQNKIGYVFPNIENRVEPFEDDIVQFGTRTKQLEELEPVKLTEEILLHAGFRVDSSIPGSTSYKKHELILEVDNEHFKMHFEPGTALNVSLKFLHQLQNLYFLITGEELDIDHFW